MCTLPPEQRRPRHEFTKFLLKTALECPRRLAEPYLGMF